MNEIIEKYADHLLSEPVSKKMKSIINARALGCAFVLLIPFPALDDIIYAVLLWTMYGKIAKAAGVPFRDHFVSNVIGGFIINIIIVLILDSFLLEPLAAFIGPGTLASFIGSFIVGFLATQWSGNAFVNQLKLFHGKKVAEHPNVRVEGVQIPHQQQINPNNGTQHNAIQPMYNQQSVSPQYNQQATQQMYNRQVAPPMYNQQQTQNSNLLTCPDCGQMVSRRADACPNCGCPVSEMN